MGTGLEILAATALVGSMAASTAGAIDTHNNMKKQRTQQREARKEAEQTKIEQENKQKELQDTYRNMKTNLYSGDINGIESNKLIQ